MYSVYDTGDTWLVFSTVNAVFSVDTLTVCSTTVNVLSVVSTVYSFMQSTKC